ncbi:hypothetical protein [Cobetia sp. QF-1]|nr:hypothetical protein [Cobetia sp. QF-1]
MRGGLEKRVVVMGCRHVCYQRYLASGCFTVGDFINDSFTKDSFTKG